MPRIVDRNCPGNRSPQGGELASIVGDTKGYAMSTAPIPKSCPHYGSTYLVPLIETGLAETEQDVSDLWQCQQCRKVSGWDEERQEWD